MHTSSVETGRGRMNTMHTTTTTKLGKSVAAGLARAAFGPLRVVSHDRLVGVLLSPRDALHLGVICEHGEDPEECSICGPEGRIRRHLSRSQAEAYAAYARVAEGRKDGLDKRIRPPAVAVSKDAEEPGPHGLESAAAEPGSERPGQGDSPRGTAEDPAGPECPDCGGRLSAVPDGRWWCSGCDNFAEPAANKTEAE